MLQKQKFKINLNRHNERFMKIQLIHRFFKFFSNQDDQLRINDINLIVNH